MRREREREKEIKKEREKERQQKQKKTEKNETRRIASGGNERTLENREGKDISLPPEMARRKSRERGREVRGNPSPGLDLLSDGAREDEQGKLREVEKGLSGKPGKNKEGEGEEGEGGARREVAHREEEGSSAGSGSSPGSDGCTSDSFREDPLVLEPASALGSNVGKKKVPGCFSWPVAVLSCGAGFARAAFSGVERALPAVTLLISLFGAFVWVAYPGIFGDGRSWRNRVHASNAFFQVSFELVDWFLVASEEPKVEDPLRLLAIAAYVVYFFHSSLRLSDTGKGREERPRKKRVEGSRPPFRKNRKM